jgi:hypothetical protein
MALDPYSYCPGGRDKKIRFCCPDKIKELSQIEKMLNDQQFSACLVLIEREEKKDPGCACLSAAKITVLRALDRFDEAAEEVERFVQREPENSLARAERAIIAAMRSDPGALRFVLEALGTRDDNSLHGSSLYAMSVVAQRLLQEGKVIPAIALIRQVVAFQPQNREALELLSNALQMENVPTILKEITPTQSCPEGVPFKAEFDHALDSIHHGQWLRGRDELEALREKADAWPYFWKSLYSLYFWLDEQEKAVEAIEKFVGSEKVDFFDAAQSEYLRLLLDFDPLGDRTAVVQFEREVTDFDRVQEALLSSPRAQSVEFDPRMFRQEDGPAPKNVFVLLDRPFPPRGEEVTLENVASQMGTLLLYGKQTDRPARMDVLEVLQPNVEPVNAFLEESLNEWIGDLDSEETMRTVSRSQAMMQTRFRFQREHLPERARLRALLREHLEEEFLPAWCRLPLGRFDGQTPEQAAEKEENTRPLMGITLLLESWMDPEMGLSVANRLREKLGLPTLDPITIDPANQQEEFMNLTTSELYRVETEGLSPDLISRGFRTAMMVNDPRSGRIFAQAIVEQPIDKTSREDRILAYRHLIEVTGSTNQEEAFAWLTKARDETKQTGQSCAIWDLAELPLRLQLLQSAEAQTLVDHLMREHRDEPGVLESLQSLFMEMGLIRPDGSPAAAPPPGATPPPTSPGQPAPDEANGKLWTPDGDAPPPPSEQEGGGGSKLWTPD